MRRLIAGLMSMALINSHVQGQGEEGDRVLLERTSCNGSCPVYSIEISRMGTVTFSGKANVLAMNATRKVDDHLFRSVVSHLDGAGFFQLNSSIKPGDPGCKHAASDAISSTLSVIDGSRSKIVSAYYGCISDSAFAKPPPMDLRHYMDPMLARFDSLTHYVDSVAGTNEWLPRRAPRTNPIHHYVFIGREREMLASSPAFLGYTIFDGVQITYPWAQLERAKGQYDFSAIRDDLALLKSKNKKLWIQLSDVSFSESRTNVPAYLTTDSAYHGGVAKQYLIQGDDESTAKPTGYVARRWDPAVQDRFHRLLVALGKEFDGKIEGINLTETSITFGWTGKFFPAGWKREEYPAAIATNFKALKLAFPKSVAMQYANFMPGEWRPTQDKGYLRRVYDAARDAKVGVGGPDLMPYQPGQLESSYPLIRQMAGSVPTGIAVQDGNLEETNPETGKRVTVTELLDFALKNLRVDYIFWGTEEPYFSRDVVPALAQRAGH